MSLWDGDDGERFILVSQNSKSFCQMIIMIITMMIIIMMMIMMMGEMTRSGSHPDNAGEHKSFDFQGFRMSSITLSHRQDWSI